MTYGLLDGVLRPYATPDYGQNSKEKSFSTLQSSRINVTTLSRLPSSSGTSSDILADCQSADGIVESDVTTTKQKLQELEMQPAERLKRQ